MRTMLHIIAIATLGCFTAVTLPAAAKTVAECNAEYAANKAAIQGAKMKKADFMAQCKAGTETIPPAPSSTAAPAPAPAPTTTAAPAPSAPTAANQFADEASAKGHCGAGLVVWVNTKSKVYHFAGSRDYGRTKQGAYMCETEAQAAGDRAAKNEKHP